MESRPRFARVIIYYVRLSIFTSVRFRVSSNAIASLLSILLGGFSLFLFKQDGFVPLFATAGSNFFRGQGKLFWSCIILKQSSDTKHVSKGDKMTHNFKLEKYSCVSFFFLDK